MVRRSAIRSPLVDLTNVAVDLHHILTDALGAGTVDPQIDIERFTLVDGDRLLLTTNGLTDVVGDVVIASVLASPRTLQQQCDALLEAARAGETVDDATAVLARYDIQE
jgi:serine/threonine protein phosphatase PrpC